MLYVREPWALLLFSTVLGLASAAIDEHEITALPGVRVLVPILI
jgi:hypothetical protein